MRGLLGRDNPLSNAFELINRRMEEEAEAEKTKQALTYWNVTKNCLNCTKNLKCNLPRSARNARVDTSSRQSITWQKSVNTTMK